MRKWLAVCCLVWLAGVFLVSDARADEITYKFGASERIRQEIWDNLINLKTYTPVPKDFNFFRFKTSLWGSAEFNKDTNVYLRFTSEIYYYPIGPREYPKSNTGTTVLDENEGVIDNIYIKANNAFGLPIDLKIGRQDFWGASEDMYGEGFLFSDGTPQDGSRTFYFNAAKAKWKIDQNNAVDFVFITNQWQDKYLPTWKTAIENSLTYYNKNKILDASNSQAYMVYGRNKVTEKLTIEPYYIYKREEETPIVEKIPELGLNTLGARAVYKSDPWTFGGEFAYQFGEYETREGARRSGQDREGYGGYIFGKHKFGNMKLKPEFELRFVYLSGDDPSTSKNENFDPLYSRQPYWNELLGYVMINEFIRDAARVAFYWSNSQLYMAKVKMELSEKTTLSLSYQYWRANEWAQPATATLSKMFDQGYERGHLPTLFLTHKFNKHIDAFFQYEYFVPGDFYADNAKCGQFLRWNVQFKI